VKIKFEKKKKKDFSRDFLKNIIVIKRKVYTLKVAPILYLNYCIKKSASNYNPKIKLVFAVKTVLGVI
jgi:hypothetical protein